MIKLYIKGKKDINNAFLGKFTNVEIAKNNLKETNINFNDCIIIYTKLNSKLKKLYYSSDFEEMTNYSLSKHKEELNKQQRNQLLKKGTITKDGKIWFNYDTASMFIQAVSTMEQDETLPWRDKNREIIELSYEEAKAYTKEIRKTLQKLYGVIN